MNPANSRCCPRCGNMPVKVFPPRPARFPGAAPCPIQAIIQRAHSQPGGLAVRCAACRFSVLPADVDGGGGNRRVLARLQSIRPLPSPAPVSGMAEVPVRRAGSPRMPITQNTRPGAARTASQPSRARTQRRVRYAPICDGGDCRCLATMRACRQLIELSDPGGPNGTVASPPGNAQRAARRRRAKSAVPA
jgi:hypothetical protein